MGNRYKVMGMDWIHGYGLGIGFRIMGKGNKEIENNNNT